MCGCIYNIQGVDGQVVGKVRRDDPASWSEAHGWDVDEEGMIGLPPVWSSRAMHNRQADKVLETSYTSSLRPHTLVA